MYQYQSAAVHVPLHVSQLATKLLRLRKQWQARNGSIPGIADLAGAAGVPVERAQRALHAAHLQAAALADKKDEDQGSIVEAPGTLDLQQLDMSVDMDESEAVEAGLTQVGGPGMKLTDVAKHFQVSRQRSHQMMESAVKHLKQQLRQAAANDAEVALLIGSK
eukprot:gene8162-8351_t